MKINRLAKGEAYYYINIPSLKVCGTNDWYFDTDNERFGSGNYFVNSRDAHECFDVIIDKYGERLVEINEQKERAKDKFHSAINKLVRRAKGDKKVAVENDSPEKQIKDLIKLSDEYLNNRAYIQGLYHDVVDSINNIIGRAKK